MTSSNGNNFLCHWSFVRRIHRSPVNSPHTGHGVTRSFDGIFDLRPNKRLSKQWWGWWFEMLSSSSWRHCNGMSNPLENNGWDYLPMSLSQFISVKRPWSLVFYCVDILFGNRSQFPFHSPNTENIISREKSFVELFWCNIKICLYFTSFLGNFHRLWK